MALKFYSVYKRGEAVAISVWAGFRSNYSPSGIAVNQSPTGCKAVSASV